MSSRLTDSGIATLQGGRTGNNEIITNNEDQVKQPNIIRISNSNQPLHVATDEVGLEDFLKAGPREEIGP